MKYLSIYRGGRSVRTYLSTLGRFRETRLTATLGFLTSRFPEHFLPLLGLKPSENAQVIIEETDEGDRFDVTVQAGRTHVILEGKIGLKQNQAQLMRYIRSLRTRTQRRPGMVLVDFGRPTRGNTEDDHLLRKHVRFLHYVGWDQVAHACKAVARSKKAQHHDPMATAIAVDFIEHLKENGMMNNGVREVYLRELSTPGSVELYFRYHIYKSQPKFLKSAQGNLYFAPYFTAKAPKRLSEVSFLPISQGISFISKVQGVEVVSRTHLHNYLRSQGIEDIKRASKLIWERHKEREILIMRLKQPYQIFQTPISKWQLDRADKNIRFGAGALGSRPVSLELLLAAARITNERGRQS